MNDDLLKEAGGGRYFKELLETNTILVGARHSPKWLILCYWDNGQLFS